MRRWTAAIPVVASFVLSAGVFAKLPASARPDLSPLLPFALPPGEPMPRLVVAFLVPIVGLAVWLLLTTLSKVRKGGPPLPSWWLNEETGASSIRRFEPTYGTISFGITALLALMHIGLLAGVLDWPDWTYQVLTATVGLGMIAIGNVMPRTKPNWIAGLRTKRTLGDPVVWLRTHRLLGALMIVAGTIVVIASIIAPRYALIFALGLLIVSFPIAQFAGARTGGIASGTASAALFCLFCAASADAADSQVVVTTGLRANHCESCSRLLWRPQGAGSFRITETSRGVGVTKAQTRVCRLQMSSGWHTDAQRYFNSEIRRPLPRGAGVVKRHNAGAGRDTCEHDPHIPPLPQDERDWFG